MSYQLNFAIVDNDDTPSIASHTSMCGGRPYTVYKYDKEAKDIVLTAEARLFRSVVLDQHNTVVAFAPPKSMPCDDFIVSHLDVSTVVAEEFVEGTMVNAFFDTDIQQWEITTRSTVGACSTFYQVPDETTMTFREMFNDAARACLLNLNTLNPRYCYSFVLQHPRNRIVAPVERPQLYLIQVYEIDGHTIRIMPREPIEGTSVKLPNVYSFKSYAELVDRFGTMNTPYYIMGVVLFDPATGERAKIRNPNYEQVRELRGNQPKLQFQYLSLRKEGKVSEHLGYYPEHKRAFSKFRDQVHLFTNQLYANYINCYVKKVKTLKEYPNQFRTHMFTLHTRYLNDLMPQHGSITNTYVRDYVNGLPTALLMHCINYEANQANARAQEQEQAPIEP